MRDWYIPLVSIATCWYYLIFFRQNSRKLEHQTINKAALYIDLRDCPRRTYLPDNLDRGPNMGVNDVFRMIPDYMAIHKLDRSIGIDETPITERRANHY